MSKNTITVILATLVIIGGLALYSASKVMEDAAKTVFVTGPLLGYAKSPALGDYITDPKGMTLYTFADDKKLESVCYGECLEKWPMFEFNNKHITEFKDSISKKVNVVKRTDNWRQYAWGDKPLYYYIGDKTPGDVRGNGMDNGKWSIVLITQ